jgi:PKD repeat protein
MPYIRLLKHRLFLILLPLLTVTLAHTQGAYGQTQRIRFNNNTDTASACIRKISDHADKGLEAEYHFNFGTWTLKQAAGRTFRMLRIPGTGVLSQAGKPALPVIYDLVLIPQNTTVNPECKILKSESYSPWTIWPARKPATDREGDGEPEFEIDEALYASADPWPAQPVSLVKTIQIRGLNLAIIRVCPVQFTGATNTITVATDLSYRLRFSNDRPFVEGSQNDPAFFQRISALILNPAAIQTYCISGIKTPKAAGNSADYLILTPDIYKEAADTLAMWKTQMGYHCEVISAPSWTSPQIKAAVAQRYQAYSPHPSYLVLLGDHDLMPGEIHQDPLNTENFATDLYYACMDGPGDDVADMAFGRISVSSASQALSTVQKIIAYEKNPPLNTAFYQSGTVCGQFQDDDSNSYEDRRFALTAEEIRDYMTTQGFAVDRIYKCDADVTPLYWNNDYYAAGENVPAYLRKPGFAWDGDRYDIRDALNSSSGRLFIAHRDHGFVGGSGWATPQFTTSDINMLNNGNRLPVVFSINCYTGQFTQTECFAEKLLRYNNGGAAGVFAASCYSYSGYNDGLILGMFDAIWASPGLYPNFTGYADDPTGSPSAHPSINTMGDVLNQSLLRMVQTWGYDNYTFELFHYFGDPAMKIWTGVPAAINAVCQDSLHCGDTTFSINSLSAANCTLTLVVDGNLIASSVITGTSGIIHFPAFSGTNALLTISGDNLIPKIIHIPVSGNCPSAAFSSNAALGCTGETFTFTNTSHGTLTACNWDFGSGANPSTATGNGPHNVIYNSPGLKQIRLIIESGSYSDTCYRSVEIDQVCSYPMISNASFTISACSGRLFDSGGEGAYPDNTNDTVYIVAPGADSIRIQFNDFDVEPGSGSSCDYDLLQIFDGPTTASPLLGAWCNTAGLSAPASITSSGNSFTVVFHSDLYTHMRGFDLEWACISTAAAPVAMFNARPQSSCNGGIQFNSHCSNSPTSYLWDFGDGNSSTLAYPFHTYDSNGTYTVSLTATNAYGNHTYTQLNYIFIDRPEKPVTDSSSICASGTAVLHASGDGTIEWYDAPLGGNLIASGNTLNTGTLSEDSLFYVSNSIRETVYVGPPDSSLSSGAYYTGSTSHFLRFDALQDLTLKSVLVYAQTSATRHFRLRNASGILLKDTAVLLAAGAQRVTLNFAVAEGSGYRLECDSLCRLYRNGAGAVFPYTIPNLISITGNSYINQNYYYYFYDWEILMNACTSPRAAVPVYVRNSAPIAAFSLSQNLSQFQFTDLSSEAVYWDWNFDDGYTSAIQNPSHTYTANGIYHVILTASNACGSDTASATISLFTVSTGESGDEGFSVMPNPSNNSITIRFNENMIPDFIDITDLSGRVLRKIACKEQKSIVIDLSIYASGVYFIRSNDSAVKVIKF